MNEIDSITLSCFANKHQYDSAIKRSCSHNDKSFISDKKFYKKRIIDLTKKIFRDEIDNHELIRVFNSYTRSCINYFKFLDTTDILQYKYSSIIDISNNESDYDDKDMNMINYDMLLMKKEDIKQINLDTFIIKKNNKTTHTIMPKKENINIKTKEHKIKGLKKKKNINNIYEDEDKKEKNEI